MFITYAKFSKTLTFLTLWYGTYFYVRNVGFWENYASVLNEWFLIQERMTKHLGKKIKVSWNSKRWRKWAVAIQDTPMFNERDQLLQFALAWYTKLLQWRGLLNISKIWIIKHWKKQRKQNEKAWFLATATLLEIIKLT